MRKQATPLMTHVQGPRTVADRLAEFGDAARARMKPGFVAAGITYPPAKVVLLALKAERVMEVHAIDRKGISKRIITYPIRGASGVAGPKLREGDRQVPEGIYAIESANPNSRFHVSLRVGYPNAFDRRVASEEGRTNLGGDIMIHGGSASVGCLAMGDEVAEELFTLADDVGLSSVEVVLAPLDLRKQPVPPALNTGRRAEMYSELSRRMAAIRE